MISLDIMMNHRLTISPATAELFEIGSTRVAKLSYPNELATKMVVSLNKMVVTDQYSSLQEKCRKVLKGFLETSREPDYNKGQKHNHTLDIVVDNYNLKYIRPRRCWDQRIRIVEDFNDLLQKGVLKRGSGATCAPPVTCVKKRTGIYELYAIILSGTFVLQTWTLRRLSLAYLLLKIQECMQS